MSSSPRRLAVLLAALLCAPALLHAQQPSFPFRDRTLELMKRSGGGWQPLRVRVVGVSMLAVALGSIWAVQRSPW